MGDGAGDVRWDVASATAYVIAQYGRREPNAYQVSRLTWYATRGASLWRVDLYVTGEGGESLEEIAAVSAPTADSAAAHVRARAADRWLGDYRVRVDVSAWPIVDGQPVTKESLSSA